MRVLTGVFVAGLTAVSTSPVWADEQSFDLSGFDQVDVSAGVEVEISGGDAFSVTATGSGRALERLDIELDGDVLRVSQRARGLARFSPILSWTSGNAHVSVVLPQLTSVAASSGSDVTVTSTYSPAFSATSSSGASLDLFGLEGGNVTLDTSSGAGIEAGGTCAHLEVKASSGADIDARDLSCNSAEATASSGADIEITAVKVVANASSGAQVEVFGASEIDANESSGGEVEVGD